MNKPRLEIQMASEIPMKAARWLWKDRLPMGSLSLLAGAEGIGKSSLTYNLIAQITKGTLDGYYLGTPKTVAIVATEDSWEHTIVPRLIAAGADLSQVFMVEAELGNGSTAPVSFPEDIEEFGKLARANDVALIVLDPLMSRIGNGLDTHKDSEVRQALEPLVQMASKAGASVIGILHINKRNSSDMLNNLMGSRAFSAVSRAVLYVQEDPEDRETKYVHQAKSNLGPSTGLTDLKFQIEGIKTGDYYSEEYGDEEIWASRLVWTGEEFGGATKALNYKPDVVLGRPVINHNEDRKQRILANVAEHRSEPRSASGLYKVNGGNRSQFFQDVKELIAEDRLLLTDQKKLKCVE